MIRVRAVLAFSLFTVIGCGQDPNILGPAKIPETTIAAQTPPTAEVPAPTPAPAPSVPTPPTTQDCGVRATSWWNMSPDGLVTKFGNGAPCQEKKSYLLATFRLNSADFFDQTRVELQEIWLGPGESAEFVAHPPTKCYQTDFYGEITKADVESGKVLIHPKDEGKPGFVSTLKAHKTDFLPECASPPPPPPVVTATGACNTGVVVNTTGAVTASLEIDYVDPLIPDPPASSLVFTTAGSKTVDVTDGKSYSWVVKVAGQTVASGKQTGCEPPPPPVVTATATCNTGVTVNTTGAVTIIVEINYTDPAVPDPPATTLTFTAAGSKTVDVTDGKSYNWTVKVNGQTVASGTRTGCEPQTCEATNPPKFQVSFPTISGDVISGQAEVKNDGNWELILYATTNLSEYNNDRPDYTKDTDSTVLKCLGVGTLKVSYNWKGHPAKYWWVVLKRNGAVVSKSPATIKP